MRVALCQLNPVVGDIRGNLERLTAALEELAAEKPDLVVLPELFVCGYPPLDLLSYPWFVDACEEGLAAVRRVSERFPEMGILVGAVTRSAVEAGRGLHNCAVLLLGGKELLRQPKTLLPTYDVFDEARWFDPAVQTRKVRLKDRVLGVSVRGGTPRTRLPIWRGPGSTCW
jgi:NAD+ synthase (glutamine-hydrolysing)